MQKALDIDNCANMDISAGCSGFVYALATAVSLMDSMDMKAAIVLSCGDDCPSIPIGQTVRRAFFSETARGR